ncbi:MAG: hypothetical protein ACJA06_001221 [Halocynthiibacter sp.]|jgi:hypothetical protein
MKWVTSGVSTTDCPEADSKSKTCRSMSSHCQIGYFHVEGQDDMFAAQRLEAHQI